MPWWSWIVIWVVLVVLALGYLVLLGLHLWHKLVRLGREAAETSSRLSVNAPPAGSGSAGAALAPDPFRAPAVASRVYREGKAARAAARAHRRVQRRKVRGQAQSLKDLRREGVNLYP